MSNYEKYIKIFIDTLVVTEEEAKTLKYQSTSNWDSVGHMSLISSIEDTFDVMMDTDDIIDFSSFDKGIEILKKYDVEV